MILSPHDPTKPLACLSCRWVGTVADARFMGPVECVLRCPECGEVAYNDRDPAAAVLIERERAAKLAEALAANGPAATLWDGRPDWRGTLDDLAGRIRSGAQP